ncbi:MAG: hypothetical protein N2422_06725, partial [Rhodobacteraceae bacterium]|nr:hypothetical protein [Paracoccaceae bacterium]
MAHKNVVSLSLPADVLAAIGRAALAAGVSPSAHVEDLLRRTYMPRASHPAAKLALLRGALDAARDWLDLQTRLRRLGYVLRIDGEAGLWLHSWPDDRPLMPSEDLGHTLSGLVLRSRAVSYTHL